MLHSSDGSEAERPGVGEETVSRRKRLTVGAEPVVVLPSGLGLKVLQRGLVF